MTKFQLRKDITALLNARAISLHKLAQETGVDSASLWRFMNRADANLNTDNLFKLWPHIYGEQSPTLLPACDGQKGATESHPETVEE